MSRRNGKTLEKNKEFMERIKEVNKLIADKKISYCIFSHPETYLSKELEDQLKKADIKINKLEFIPKGNIYYMQDIDFSFYKELAKRPFYENIDWGSEDYTIGTRYFKNEAGSIKIQSYGIIPKGGII